VPSAIHERCRQLHALKSQNSKPARGIERERKKRREAHAARRGRAGRGVDGFSRRCRWGIGDGVVEWNGVEWIGIGIGGMMGGRIAEEKRATR